jgi:hypothetical protein
MWSIYFAHTACFDCSYPQFGGGMGGTVQMVDSMAGLWQYAGPGHWNDPDIMQVGTVVAMADGRPNLNVAESRAEFSLWCMLAAPLLIGADVRKVNADFAGILLNREVIAVNQDSLGAQARKVRDEGEIEVFVKPLCDSSRAVVLFNRSSATKQMNIRWQELGWNDGDAAGVRDLWKHEDMGEFKTGYSAPVASHDIVMLKIAVSQPTHLKIAPPNSGIPASVSANPSGRPACPRGVYDISGRLIFAATPISINIQHKAAPGSRIPGAFPVVFTAHRRDRTASAAVLIIP